MRRCPCLLIIHKCLGRCGPVQSSQRMGTSLPLVDSYFVGGLRKKYVVTQDWLWHVSRRCIMLVKLACCQGVPRVSLRGGAQTLGAYRSLIISHIHSSSRSHYQQFENKSGNGKLLRSSLKVSTKLWQSNEVFKRAINAAIYLSCCVGNGLKVI